MLSMKGCPLFSSPFPSTFLPSKHLKRPISLSTKISKSSIKMSMVEHVVLFKVKDGTDQPKVDAMVNGLNALASLESVIHLTAGPILRIRSPISEFTHMIHSRYKSKDDLNAYSAHPDHTSAVQENILPICDDVMAVDWIADNDPSPISPPSGSAFKVTFMKLKENVSSEVQGEVLQVIRGFKEGISGIQQMTCGENFSPARANGFSLASIAFFLGVEESKAAEGNEFVTLQKQKIGDHLDGVIVVDYVVP